MSHLGYQEGDVGLLDQPAFEQPDFQSSSLQYSQDSPTIGRAQIQPHSFADQAIKSPLPTPSRSQRKPAPSPLHASTAISPPSSTSPSRSHFPSPPYRPQPSHTPPQPVTIASQPVGEKQPSSAKTYFDSDSSGPETPEASSPGPALSPRFPNDAQRASGPVVTERPLAGNAKPSSTMTGSSTTPRLDLAKGGSPRNSSIDSAASSRSQPNRMAAESQAGTPDVASLIKTAGSAEAVIRYLLKEKQSQTQQNSQLWRLVDKQRAMILGLNKDLERALKDKEKYRKKLKEVMAAADVPPVPAALPKQAPQPPAGVPKLEMHSPPKPQVLEIPVSPGLDSDSQKHSPIDMALAPYPITPPADHIPPAPPSAVGDMLDPTHMMPNASEHALDQYDHDRQERDAEEARKQADAVNNLPINLNLPPSRSLPSQPPRLPPPPPPSNSIFEVTPMIDEGLAQFPPPPAPLPRAPPPRKLPPAPLQLRHLQQSPTVPPEEELETDSDYDDILEVNELKADDKRGRRRTREEDEHDREILARKEAEFRSLSKKSKKSTGSLKGTPTQVEPEVVQPEMPISPRLAMAKNKGLQRENVPASLAGVLNGNVGPELDFGIPPSLLSPGLPSSPRPMGMKSPITSPPLSPLGVTAFPGTPLSPRPPRQAIPLPPNTPLQSPSHAEPMVLTSPKPLNILKKIVESGPLSPTRTGRESAAERTRVFKGLVTEENPDLLLPPNALTSIDIRVASSRMKPSRASLLSLTQLEEDPVFTLAILSRTDGGELWRVEKDSSSLAKLDQRLKQCSAFTAKTPDRSLFTGHAPAKLDARRMALDQYLDELLNTPLDNAAALELCKYLSCNTLPPNADETGSSPTGPAKDTSPKTGPGGRPLRTGYLTKRGKNFGGWKARFFVLDGPLLKYYETPGGAHLGTIKLQKAQIGKQSQHNNDGASPARAPAGSEDDNQYRHAFLILEPKKKDPNSITKHVLCAESDRERDQWVDTLLRWIDYRDPDDDEPPTKKDQTHDRHGSGGSERQSGMNTKRRTYGGKQQQQRDTNDGEDPLIGVSYEATRQGDIPQGAPSRSKNSGHNDHEPHAQTMTSQASYSISAPKDPQVISDSSSWGSKLGMSLAPPNQEEKKARKRSFFGFGPKTRSSSDGQDSLFGSDNSSGPPGPSSNQPPGPIRQVFGASLAEAVRYNSPVDVRVPLPAVVYRCIQYLDANNAILEEGIFRLSGSNVVIKGLRERFNNESDINLIADEQYHDIHAVASLLKLYLRELPTTILTRDLHMEFVSVTEMTVQKEKIAALSELVERLPQANATLLKYLIAFLIKIINNQDMNKMSVRNVGIVFSPTLNIPAPVFALLLQNYEPIFGIDPMEYELPQPVSEKERERRPSNPERGFQDRRPSDSQQRPSTSGTGSSSPHRQRLMDAVKEGQNQRSTPTPPPVLMSMQQMAQLNAAQYRSSPTPPPQRLTSYEPSFLAQQNQAGSHVSLRPAYESGFVVPPGYDVTQFQQAPQQPARSQQPGYDRPIYDSGAPAAYDQPYSARSRRESAMFMAPANLNQQGSRSRLREEAQF